MLHPMLIEFLPVRYRGKVTILTGFVQGINPVLLDVLHGG